MPYLAVALACLLVGFYAGYRFARRPRQRLLFEDRTAGLARYQDYKAGR